VLASGLKADAWPHAHAKDRLPSMPVVIGTMLAMMLMFTFRFRPTRSVGELRTPMGLWFRRSWRCLKNPGRAAGEVSQVGLQWPGQG